MLDDDLKARFIELMGFPPPEIPPPYEPVATEDWEESFPVLEKPLPLPQPNVVGRCPDDVDLQEFSPLDPSITEQILQRVVKRMFSRGPWNLTQIPDFLGCGVYCLSGPDPIFGEYTQLYFGQSQAASRMPLCNRIRKHLKSISQTTLDPANITYRVLVLHPTFVNLVEIELIKAFQPLWNGSGFGTRGEQGAGRSSQQVSIWDTEYTGRDVTEVPRNLAEVRLWFENKLPYTRRATQAAYERFGIDLNSGNHAENQEVGPPGATSPALDAGREALNEREESLPAHVRQRSLGPGHPTQQEAEALD